MSGVEADVVQLLEDLIRSAVHARASDIHLEPKEDRLRVRFRIDGVMAEQHPIPGEYTLPVISRAKILAKMDIAEKRQPQDGNFKLNLSPNPVSLRVSTFPCMDGEKMVMRVLKGVERLNIDQLGMGSMQANTIRRLARRNSGLILVTGPTGSGKTSTLYAMLQEMDTNRLNVVTLEDPIEMQMVAITQGQIHPRAGFTFASGLRSILRQDPDVILVGEMRDLETASIALQASLTGHLVLSTVHTNSAVETITRLTDIGLEPYIVANALIGIISQRLLRRVCGKCARAHAVEVSVAEEVGFTFPLQANFVQEMGCAHCLKTGYRGRLGIYEILEVDDRLRKLIKGRASTQQFKSLLRDMNVPTLRRVGIHHASQGITTPEEVLRIT